MNYDMIFKENNKFSEQLQETIGELDNQLEKVKKLDEVLNKYEDIEQCDVDVINSFDTNEIDGIVYTKRQEIREITSYLDATNYELKIKYVLINQKLELINNMLISIQYLNNNVDFSDELLNKFMEKVQGYLIWKSNRLSVEPMKSFEILKDNKKQLFKFIWAIQKIRYLKDVYITAIGLIKLINCNYIDIGENKLEEKI